VGHRVGQLTHPLPHSLTHPLSHSPPRPGCRRWSHPPLPVWKIAPTTLSPPVSPRINRCFLFSSAHSPPACRSAVSSLASVDAPTHPRCHHALCVFARHSCCDPQPRASRVALAAALAATSSLASRGDAARTQTDSGGRLIVAAAVPGPAGARRIAFLGGGCLPRGRRSCLFMAGWG